MASLGVSSRRLIFILHSKKPLGETANSKKFVMPGAVGCEGSKRYFFHADFRRKVTIFQRFPIRTPEPCQQFFLLDFFYYVRFCSSNGGWVLVAMENIFQLNSECFVSCWDKKKRKRKKLRKSALDDKFQFFAFSSKIGKKEWRRSGDVWKVCEGFLSSISWKLMLKFIFMSIYFNF